MHRVGGLYTRDDVPYIVLEFKEDKRGRIEVVLSINSPEDIKKQAWYTGLERNLEIKGVQIGPKTKRAILHAIFKLIDAPY